LEVSVDARHRRRWAAVLLPLLVAPVLIGCSTSSDPYSAVVEKAARQATSDFERDVFADLRVTPAEYEEAVTRYIRCANDRGVKLTKIPQAGYYTYEFPQTAEAGAVLEECVKGTTVLIEPIYVEMITNPNREDIDDLIASCVVRKGLAPTGYSGAQIKAEKEAARRAGRGIDFPFDEDDPRFAECMADPRGRA
jgi:hypothetical protein